MAAGLWRLVPVSFGVVLAPFSPIRRLITILLMVSMPLCCCNFRSLGRCCGPVGAPASSSHVHEHGAVDEHADCHGGHEVTNAPSGTDPCGPGHDDGDQCACGKSLTKMGLVGKPVVEIPALAFVAILPLPTMPLADSVPTHVASFWAARLLVPPATTLLRLHCALTV